ncbi:MAG: hypothetical protein HPY53_14260 [Brevinematales bacterium]|nr:hypothetical protein [Brevinematales bacterium]
MKTLFGTIILSMLIANGIFSAESAYKTPGLPPMNKTAKKAGSQDKIPGSVSIKAKQPPKDNLLKILYQYYPTGYSIIAALDNYPEKIDLGGSSISFSKDGGYQEYIHGSTPIDRIGCLSTAVHEMNHGFTKQYSYLILRDTGEYDYMYNYYTYCIDEQETVLVSFGKTFPCGELNKFVPQKLQTFRFEVYVYPSHKYQSTQMNGIFALLDEYNAYYHGAMTVYSLFDYFRTELEQDDTTWGEYIRGIVSTYSAYAEFRYWILAYLLYAKEKHPSIYKDIMDNQVFRQVFAKIDERYTSLISAIDERIEEVAALLRSLGYKSGIENGNFRLENSYIGLDRTAYDLLMKEMGKSEYRNILAELASF